MKSFFDVAKKNTLGVFAKKEAAVTIIYLMLCIGTAMINSVFLSPNNLINVLRAISLAVIPAIGVTIVMSAGSIDLSCGATLGFVGIVFGYLYGRMGMHVVPAFLLSMLVAMMIGLTIGLVLANLNLPAMIVTLAMQKICRGLIDVIAGGQSMTGFSESFNKVGQGFFLGIPNVIYIALLFLACGWIFCKYSVMGRKFIAMGGNSEATRLAGIDIKKYKVISHIICSMLAGFAGILLASRLGSAQPTAGTSQDLNVIASAIIGGNSLSGGVATMFGTMIGVAIMETLTISLTLIHVSAYWQNVCIGVIVLVAVSLDQFQQMKKMNKV